MQSLEVLVDPLLTPEMRERLVQIWVDVTNTGGAAGFLPPVSRANVEPVATALFARAGPDGDGLLHLLVARDESEPVGWGIVEQNARPVVAHWASIRHLQVHPTRQGHGVGRALMHTACDLARDGLGLEQLHLALRSGMGLETFYATLGFREVGRLPRCLRLAPDDYRDEVYMVLQPL